MNLIKIGKFLQTLRKERGYTQEVLAEELGVSRRTISRWETGHNLPDISVLIEISDFYAVDLREILSGERKHDRMNHEMKETVVQVAAYSQEDKARFMKKVHRLFIAGLVGFLVYLGIKLTGLNTNKVYDVISGFGLGLAFGTVVLGLIVTGQNFTSLRAGTVQEKEEEVENDHE